MIELMFNSDTNQQLAEQVLSAKRIETRRGDPGCLEIDRETLAAHLPEIEATLADYNGRIWTD